MYSYLPKDLLTDDLFGDANQITPSERLYPARENLKGSQDSMELLLTTGRTEELPSTSVGVG